MSIPQPHPSRRLPLAACVAVAFSLASPLALAATWTVDSCADGVSGSGSTGTLRYAAANAPTGSTIDLSALPAPCNSTISLTTGAVVFGQNNLNVKGATNGSTITAMNSPVKDRVITHNGTGNLTLTDLNIEHGDLEVADAAKGGCIFSSGSVILQRSTVSQCLARSLSGSFPTRKALGGGIYVNKNLSIKYSTVADNKSYVPDDPSLGAGAYVRGGLTTKYSTISGNYARGVAGSGGGVFLHGYAASSIGTTTISNNRAFKDGGGLSLGRNFTTTLGTTITNSTISGNSASYAGGILSSAPLTINTSTIAFNTAAKGRRGAAFPFSYYAPGLALNAPSVAIAVTLYGALISNNTYGASPYFTENDLSAGDNAHTSNVTISGSNNLVRAHYSDVTLPAMSGNISFSCPLLGPLRDNGGYNLTHQLLSGSPAIDVGIDTSTATGEHHDQRGTGFLRTSGSDPDIGAYEVQQGDIVFNSGFEGCPDLF